MDQFRATLFKTLHVQTFNGKTLDLGAPTTRSLFAYLLLHRGQPVDRRSLAFQLWPRGTETAARRNLRQYIHRIRRAFEEVGFEEDILTGESGALQINSEIKIWLDIDAFRHGTRSGATLEELRAAVDLYTGDLLEDTYEDWCDEIRQSLRRRYTQVLERLTHSARNAGRLDEAIGFTQKRIVNDAYDEDAHRELMRLYALKGDRAHAIQHYHSLKKLLEEELDTSPLPETDALLHAIQKGGVASESSPPVQGFELRAEKRHPRQLPAAPALVGRETELQNLEEECSTAAQGQGRFVLVTGESGIGKTRLLQEHLNRWTGRLILHGASHELEARTPYAPLRVAIERSIGLFPGPTQALPPWMNTLAALVPALAQRYPFLLPSEIRTSDHAFIMDAFAGMLTSLSHQVDEGPLHLVFDNLHWADSLTWEVLAFLARRAASLPVLIVGLCRMEDLQPEQVRLVRTLQRNGLLSEIPLDRLDETETETLARTLLSEPPPAQFFDNIYRDTEGNPFFIIETVRAWREGGWTLSLSGGRYPGLPSGIQQVIEARLERLSPESRELLGIAAVIGREFTFPFLHTISQQPEELIIESLEEWGQRGLVREETSSYDFSHDKIRLVAYASLGRARRQYNHRRIAQALENMIPAAEAATLAYHYRNSDLPAKALPYLTEAGEQALRVRSYQEAREFGQQAVSLLGQFSGPSQRSERVDLNLQLAQAYAFMGDWKHALEILSTTENLAQSLGDELRLGKLFRRSAQIFWLRGQPEVAGDYARRTLRAAEESGDETLLHASLRMLGRVGIALSKFDDAIAYLLRYVNLEHLTRRPPALPIVLGYLGVAYARVGSWERGLEAAERGVRLAEAEGIRQTLDFARMQLGFIYAEKRDWENCRQVLAPALDHLPSDGSLTPLGFMLMSLNGRMHSHTGQVAKGIAMIRTALSWGERMDHRVFHYLPRHFLAEGLLAAGDHEQATRTVLQAIALARESGNRWSVAVSQRLLTEIVSHQPFPDWQKIEDDLIDARNTLRETRSRPDLARTYLSLRRLYDRAGQIAWAVDCHFRAITIFEETEMLTELRQAQGQAAGNRTGAVVIPNLNLRGPNVGETEGL